MSLDRLCRAVFAVFNRLSGGLDATSSHSSNTICGSMREAQRTRSTFSVEVSRTVDVLSILLNVPPRHATKYNLHVKLCPTLTTRNTSNNKRVCIHWSYGECKYSFWYEECEEQICLDCTAFSCCNQCEVELVLSWLLKGGSLLRCM
jgi:hypothetical protein